MREYDPDTHYRSRDDGNGVNPYSRSFWHGFVWGILCLAGLEAVVIGAMLR